MGIRLAALIFVVVGFFSVPARAQISVFMDFADFETRLDEATSSAGVANFNAGEVTTIRNNIINYLNTAFTGYSVNFTETNPGGVFETLNFGLTAGGGTFGRADRIDFRNQVKTDVGRVYTGNFGGFLDVGDSRGQQILELSNSLSGTASHELGHNLGLEHRDPYGISTLPPAGPGGGGPTGGLQNLHIMATGSTSLSTEQRKAVRTFSDLSHVKLEFADGVNPNALTTTLEQGGAHGTIGTAQHIDFQPLNINQSRYDLAAVVEGSISAQGGEDDYYSFDMIAGEFMTFQVISSTIFNNIDIDSFITLFDTNGVTQLIQNDETEYDGNSINPGNVFYSTDSSFYNFQATLTGTYFLETRAFSVSDTGNYELIFAKTSLFVIPEPASAGLSILIVAGLVSLRRRKRQQLSVNS